MLTNGRSPLKRTFFSSRICCCFLFPVLFPFAFTQTKTVVYTPTGEIFQNPERGFYQAEETGMVRGQITPYQKLDLERLRTIRQSHALVFRYFGLKQWRTADLPDSILRNIHSDFTAIRNAGLKCIPRFTYSANIGEPDALLSIILRHIDQLKPILRANKDVIAVMQAGFIGAWGEWHSSTNGNDSPQNMRTILNKVLEALPSERMVQVRAPRYKQQIFSLPFDSTAAIAPAQAFTGIPIARVGHHNDCFLADANDMGTYWRDNRIDTALAKAYLRLDNRFVPMGGETCQASVFALCPNAVREMGRLRWSFLNDGYDEEVISGFITGGCMDEMKRKLGYRFALLNSEFTIAVKRSGKFNFRMRLTNSGWASPFNPRDVELMVRNNRDGKVYVARLPVDPRFWQAGDTVEVNATVGIPVAMPAGAYSVLLNLPDPEPSLHFRPAYSIRFANQNTWEQNTGYNSLLDSIAIDATTSSDPYNGTLWFQPLSSNQPPNEQPTHFALAQNYPNPFNGSTTIPFSISLPGQIELSIFDLLGKKVSTLVSGVMLESAFPYSAQFDGSQVASGVYISRLRARPVNGSSIDDFFAFRKMILLK